MITGEFEGRVLQQWCFRCLKAQGIPASPGTFPALFPWCWLWPPRHGAMLTFALPLAPFFCTMQPFQEELMKLWPISLHFPTEMEKELMSSQTEEDLESRSPSLWGWSSPWRTDGRAVKSHLAAGKGQQVSPLSSPSSFSLLKTHWARTARSFVGSRKKQKTPNCSALPRDWEPWTCPKANSRHLPGFKEKSCSAYKFWFYFDQQLHGHFEKPQYGHRCVSASVH